MRPLGIGHEMSVRTISERLRHPLIHSAVPCSIKAAHVRAFNSKVPESLMDLTSYKWVPDHM